MDGPASPTLTRRAEVRREAEAHPRRAIVVDVARGHEAQLDDGRVELGIAHRVERSEDGVAHVRFGRVQLDALDAPPARPHRGPQARRPSAGHEGVAMYEVNCETYFVVDEHVRFWNARD
jgi:hypothetical protein